MEERRGTRSAWVAIAVFCVVVAALLVWQVDHAIVLVGLVGIGLLGAGTVAWERRA